MSLHTSTVPQTQATKKPHETKTSHISAREQVISKALATQTQTVKTTYAALLDTADLTADYKDGLLATHTRCSAARLHDCFTPGGASIMWSKATSIPELPVDQTEGKTTKLDQAKKYIRRVAITIKNTYLLVNILETGTKLPNQIEGRARSKMPPLGHTESSTEYTLKFLEELIGATAKYATHDTDDDFNTVFDNLRDLFITENHEDIESLQTYYDEKRATDCRNIQK